MFRYLLPCLLALFSALPVQAERPVYRFSPVNQYDINLTAAYWNPIIAYVSQASGIQLVLKIGRTSADTTAYVLAQEVEFVFSNHLFSPDRDQLGWKVIARRQMPPVYGQIVVPADSPITSLAQLKDQEVAFAGPEALIGYKFTYAHLLSQGIDVKVVFGGNQNGALAQLFAGKVKAVGGNSQLIEGYGQRENKQFRVLWRSESLLDLALMVSGKVPDKDVKAVTAAFVNMHKNSRGRDILHQASLKVGLPSDAYFIPSSGGEYSAYRKLYQTAPPALR